MRKHLRVPLVLLAISMIALVTADSAVAKESRGRHTITVMLVDAEGSKVLTMEMRSPRMLSDVFELERGHMNRGHLRRGAVKANIDGLVANMRARMQMGEGKPLSPPQEATMSLSMRSPRGSDPPMDIPVGGGGSECFKAYRAGDDDVICAGGCRDCYVEEVNP